MGAFKCPSCIHKEVCKDELLNRPINEKCAHYLSEARFMPTNKKMKRSNNETTGVDRRIRRT